MRFANKTAIVTGAGAGIGQATVALLSREGARIIASDISQDRLSSLKNSLPDADIVAVAGDISLEETAQAVVTAANGQIDILVNNAGIMDGFLPAAEVDDETWERVMAVNVTAIMRLSRQALPLMIAAKSGAIVNIASEAGLRGSVAGLAYTAAKHAVIGMTKNMSCVYAKDGIRVNAVAPGAVKTSIEAPMKSTLSAERLAPLMDTMVPRFAEAEELANVIAFLASDAASNVNGVILPADGGWSAI